ncbi:hypothetical protein [Aquimarina sp. MMG016]|uniref:hypothetical protein n=1 Tax=Aquimarina sp. MMG016 TaxID=2822690 RepID=UPI001B3A385D|nr:hypothetical protein [Aquimarina sp. MMG016]MBQ4818494.1 hypothetical protein [Aquimarina sp. MMG016]
MKIAIITSLFLYCQVFYAQSDKKTKEPLKINDSTEILTNSDSNLQATNKKELLQQDKFKKTAIIYTEKEWADIKKEMHKNKKRLTKNNVRISKVIDTVFLFIPLQENNSQITDW